MPAFFYTRQSQNHERIYKFIFFFDRVAGKRKFRTAEYHIFTAALKKFF